jgi:DNA-binding protein HU-beta
MPARFSFTDRFWQAPWSSFESPRTISLKGISILNKTELIAAIAADTNLSKTDAGRAFDSALENLSRALARGESVQLIGFGTFAVASRAERTGRNPSTGEQMTIKASKAPKFTAGRVLKDAVNKVD